MKKLISLILALLMLAGATVIPATAAGGTPFSDVKDGKWYTEAIKYAYENELMNGMTETTFEPDSPMSRAMLVTVLWRSENSAAPKGESPFTDLKAKWYKQAVAWAYENDVVKGTTETSFSPDAPVTREQIATIFFRFAQYRGRDTAARDSVDKFPDGAKVSKYAKTAMEWAVGVGLISGTKEGNKTLLDPKGNATRAQVATILMRYLTSNPETLQDKIDAFLDRYVCAYHNKLDVVFNYAGGSFTEENLASLLRQAAGLGEEVEIGIDNFEDLLGDYGGCGDDAGGYGMIWPDTSAVTFTDTVTGEVVEEEIAFSIRKCLSSAEIYPGGVLGVCHEDADPDLIAGMEEMNEIAYGEEENVFTGFPGEYTEAGIEAFFRELTGLTDPETYEFLLSGFDPSQSGKLFHAMFINKKAEDGRFDAVWNEFAFAAPLKYNEPVLMSHYTEPEYPLVDNADVYVAVDGDDNNPGTFDAPLATFAGAVAKVREIKQTKFSGDIVVAFKAGDYGPLSLTLTAEDSGTSDQKIVYCAYGDGDVTFNNGLDVTEDEFVPLDEDEKAMFSDSAAALIKKADVSDRLAEYDPTTCMILSENGVMNLARFPNMYEDGTDNLVQAGVAYDHEHIHVRHKLFKNRINKYHSVDGLILYGYIAAGWYKDMIETDGYTVDEETGNYVFFVPHPENVYCGYGPQLGDGFAGDYFQMAIINVSEELDAPGEFWIDRNTGTFYVYDPSGDYHFVSGESSLIQVNDFYYTVDEEDGMLTLGEDVGYITLLGLDFRNSNKYMIRGLHHPRGLTVDRCSFAGCAARNMIDIQASEEGEPLDLLITGCEFSSGAGRAAAVFIPDSDDLYSNGYLFTTGGNVVIDNNYVTLTGLKIGNLGAICVRVPDPLVSHNHFERCFWQCVDINQSKGAVVEYNVFDDVCCNGDDTAAIGQSCNFGGCGNYIRYNLFMNIGGGQNGRFGIYLDNAIGTTVCSNLFYKVGTTVCNNDICKYNAYCDNATVMGFDGCDYDVWHTEAVNEAAASGDFEPVRTFWTYQRWLDIFAFFESHPEIKEQMTAEWPGFFDITTDLARWEDKEFCENSSLVITGNRCINAGAVATEYDELLARYSTIEDNLVYSLEENPLFENPTAGDYRIRSDAGFPDIQFEKMGRY